MVGLLRLILVSPGTGGQDKRIISSFIAINLGIKHSFVGIELILVNYKWNDKFSWWFYIISDSEYYEYIEFRSFCFSVVLWNNYKS